MGMKLIELDFPASHGQQLHKYAKKHGVRAPTLEEAFGSTECVRPFAANPNTACPQRR
jgi:hypothetical protein